MTILPLMAQDSLGNEVTTGSDTTLRGIDDFVTGFLGYENHAANVLAKVGASELFSGIFDIRAMGYSPKPLPVAYTRFFEQHGIDAKRAAMFDDLEKNLLVPHEQGMVTVHVVASEDFTHAQVEGWELARVDAPHIHHVTDDLAGFLAKVI